MKILQRLFIMVVILLGVNFSFADVDIHVEKNGRMRVPAGGFNQNGIRPWMYLDNNGPKFHHEYVSRFDKSLHVREASTGLRSASTVPVTIERRVSKSTVFRNLLARARVGGKYAVQRAAGKLGAGLLGGPAGWAITAALTAYDLASPIAASEGYYYDDKYQDFVKPKTFVYCIPTSGLCTDQRVQETVMNPDAVYAEMGTNPSDEEINKKLCAKLEVNHFNFEYPDRFSKKNTYFNGKSKICVVEFNVLKAAGSLSPGDTTALQTRWLERVPKVKEPIPQSVFDKAVQPSADASPSKYVNATANQDGSVPGESQGNPTVSNGTVITLGPATGPDGKPVQVTITFNTPSGGNTSADVKVTPRPDLTPGSPAAPNYTPAPVPSPTPNPTPGGQPSPNPDGKPGSQPDPTPDGSPSDKPKPDPDGSPGGKDKPDPSNTPEGKDDPKPDDKPKENEKPKESGSLLCDVFPNILACDKMGKPEEGMFDAISIPQTTDDRTWSSDDFLPANGVCPQPKTFTVWGKTMTVSYQPLCTFAEKIRFAVLLSFIIMSAFIVFGSLKRG